MALWRETRNADVTDNVSLDVSLFVIKEAEIYELVVLYSLFFIYSITF